MIEIIFAIAIVAILLQRINHNRKLKRILDSYKDN